MRWNHPTLLKSTGRGSGARSRSDGLEKRKESLFICLIVSYLLFLPASENTDQIPVYMAKVVLQFWKNNSYLSERQIETNSRPHAVILLRMIVTTVHICLDGLCRVKLYTVA